MSIHVRQYQYNPTKIEIWRREPDPSGNNDTYHSGFVLTYDEAQRVHTELGELLAQCAMAHREQQEKTRNQIASQITELEDRLITLRKQYRALEVPR